MKSQVPSLSGALRIKSLVRGRLACTNRSKGGGSFYCLQYTRKGRHVTKYVPSAQVEAYREATENYRRFMEAVDEYVEAVSAMTSEEIRKEAERRRRKAGAPKSAPLAEEPLGLSRTMGASASTARPRMTSKME